MESVNLDNETGATRVRDLLRLGAERLAAAGIASPRLDAEVLLAHGLALTREQLLLAGDAPLISAAAQVCEMLLRRRLAGEPVAYITGRQEFWSLEFAVTPAVLIPRPDSERLVEVTLEWAARCAAARPLRIADLCTGSGALAISLARELPAARFWLTDISPAALEIARGNAESHGVAQRMEFFTGDLFAALAPRLAPMDLLLCNPPYVRRGEIAKLAREVSQWEPRLALDGGDDGLDFYRRLVAAAPDYVAPQGALVMEIGADMARQVAVLCAAAGSYGECEIFQDYAGRDRVVLAQLKK